MNYFLDYNHLKIITTNDMRICVLINQAIFDYCGNILCSSPLTSLMPSLVGRADRLYDHWSHFAIRAGVELHS